MKTEFESKVEQVVEQSLSNFSIPQYDLIFDYIGTSCIIEYYDVDPEALDELKYFLHSQFPGCRVSYPVEYKILVVEVCQL